MPAIKRIYDKFSGKYAMPGAVKYMSSDEFLELIETVGIVNDDFGQREILPIFNCSMMTQKDELESDRHINMTLIEFIEAIGRLAQKIKIPIPFEYMQLLYEELIDENPNWKERPPLHYTIESLIVRIVRNNLSKDFRDTLLSGMERYYKDQYNAPKRTKYAHIEGPY
mmetsp:Transcript_6402/g.5505  ORF Transcript_6402/g.5505 Transcript_6402/m.5505 type:complete len:168 (+) Transcript_6402:539-1042(+)